MYDNGEFLDEKTTQDLIPILIDQLELTNMDGFDEFCDEYLVKILHYFFYHFMNFSVK